MTALFAGLTILDVLHRLDHVPDPSLKIASTEFTVAAGGPAMNAAVTYAALCATSRVVFDPEGETGAASGAPANFEEMPILLTTLGEGLVSVFLTVDLAAMSVRVVDAAAPVSSPASREPAVSSVIEHPGGRMVASTNAQPDADAERMATDLPEQVGAIPTGGHDPTLAHAALMLGAPGVDGEDPFTPLEARPPHPRIPDDGSWKKRLTPLLGLVDIVVVSEDLAPPLTAHPDGVQIAELLRGLGVTRTTRTRGDQAVQYQQDGTSGGIPAEAVPDASTLGTGDVFHGAFVQAIERGGDADPERLARFASSVAAVSVSSFGTRQ